MTVASPQLGLPSKRESHAISKVCDLLPFKLELVAESIGTGNPTANNREAG